MKSKENEMTKRHLIITLLSLVFILTNLTAASREQLTLTMAYDQNGDHNAWTEHDLNWTWDGEADEYFANPVPGLSLNYILNDSPILNASGVLLDIYTIELQSQSDANIEIRGLNNGVQTCSLAVAITGGSPLNFTAFDVNFTDVTDIQFYSENNHIRIDNMVFEEVEIVSNLSLTGTIVDAENNPISGASISLDGVNDFDATSGTDGSFAINDLPVNCSYQMMISADGYAAQVQEISFTDSSIDLGNITLSELIYPVTNVEATLNNSGNADLSWDTPGTNISDEFRNDDGIYYCCMSFSPDQFPNHMFGSAFYYVAQVEQLKWWLVDGNGGGHPEVQLLVFGLNADGSPNSDNLIYDTGWIPNTDNEWNTHDLDEMLECDNGFYVGVRVNTGGGTYIVFDDGTEEQYPGAYPYTDIYPGESGNAWLNNDTNNAGGWSEFTYDGGNCNVMVRATGLIIDEIETTSRNISNVNPESLGAFVTQIDDPSQAKENFIQTTVSNSRDYADFTIYRVLAGDERTPENWTEIATNITATTLTDDALSSQPAGVYRYAVIANYANNEASAAKFSDLIVHDMRCNLNVNVNTDNNDDTSNAIIRLVGEDRMANIYNENSHESIIENNNTISFNVWKQEWKLYVELPGYEPYISESNYVYNDMDIDVTLVDEPVSASNVTASINSENENEVNINWSPAEEKIFSDHFYTEGCTSTITLQDFCDEGWDPFDREGAFDFVLDEASLVTKIYLRAKVGLSYSSPTFPEQLYTDPISFKIAIHQDDNGHPRENCIDTLITTPVAPNDFWEYEIPINPPLELDAGTYWIGTSGYVNLHVQDQSYMTIVRYFRRNTNFNGTEFYYRLPLDGYNQGLDTWTPISQVTSSPGTELAARVLGRPQNSDRSVTGYNIYRLNSSDEGNPSAWTLLVENHPELSYSDENFVIGNYKYAIEAVFPNNELADPVFSNEVEILTGNEDVIKPNATELVGCFPNPFNPTTTIKFNLNRAQHVAVQVYNVKGQLVQTLVDAELPAAIHEVVWNGNDQSGKNATSGIYFYKMQTEDYKSVKKMIMLK
jgi:hypothetical protein